MKSVRCVLCILSSCHRADISVALTSTKAYHKRHINNQRRLGVRLYHYSLMPTESWFNASHIFLLSAIAYRGRFISIQSSVLFGVMGETAASHLARLPNPFVYICGCQGWSWWFSGTSGRLCHINPYHIVLQTQQHSILLQFCRSPQAQKARGYKTNSIWQEKK